MPKGSPRGAPEGIALRVILFLNCQATPPILQLMKTLCFVLSNHTEMTTGVPLDHSKQCKLPTKTKVRPKQYKLSVKTRVHPVYDPGGMI